MPTLHKLKAIAERLQEARAALGSATATTHLHESVETASNAVSTAIEHYRLDCGNIAAITDTLQPIANPLLATQAEVLEAGLTEAAEQLARAVTSLDLLLAQLTKE